MMARILRVGLLNSVFGALVGINILTLVMLFRSRVHHFLLALNSRRRIGTLTHFFAKGGGRSLRRRSVVPIMVTYVDVNGRGMNTLVIVRRGIPLSKMMHAKRVVGTSMGRHLVRGVFFGGDPLRSNTVMVDGGHVGTTKYVLPMSRGLSVPGRLKLHRHTTVKVSRRSSTRTVVMSRRAKSVSITCRKRFCLHLDTRRLRDLLAGGSWGW